MSMIKITIDGSKKEISFGDGQKLQSAAIKFMEYIKDVLPDAQVDTAITNFNVRGKE